MEIPKHLSAGMRIGTAVVTGVTAAKLPDLSGRKRFQQPSEDDRYKSKWERLYATVLDDERKAGDIDRWEYEPIGLRIADGALGARGCVYWPDFVVWHKGGIECRELKGKGKYAVKDVARVKFLAARRLFPEFRFRMIQRTDCGWVDIL